MLGSGSVATAACRALIGLSARVAVLSPDLRRLAYLKERFGGRLASRIISPSPWPKSWQEPTCSSPASNCGSVAPKIVTREMVQSMGPGAVIIDMDVDLERVGDSPHASHADPTYIEEGVIHYCVPNMPGAVPRTATEALMAATLPYILSLAQIAWTPSAPTTVAGRGCEHHQGEGDPRAPGPGPEPALHPPGGGDVRRTAVRPTYHPASAVMTRSRAHARWSPPLPVPGSCVTPSVSPDPRC